jgi:tripartite-type tricarboxylate transporter receptor subunit TctC
VLGKPVIVDNRPGASGQIAAEIVAKAKPDGHTLLVSGLALVTLPGIDGARALDPLEAFVPVAWLTSQPVAIVVHPSLHVDSLRALIDEARRRPGALSFSTNGLGGPAHLAATMLFKRAQVDLVIVPYNGAGALRDLVSGEVPLTFMYLTGLGPYLREH